MKQTLWSESSRLVTVQPANDGAPALSQEHQSVRSQAEKVLARAKLTLAYADALRNGTLEEFVKSTRANGA